MGIEFDSGRNCLYQNAPKNVVCKLSSKGGHWLMDSDENKRPLAEDLWFASAAECVSAAQSVSVANVNAAEKRRRQAVKSLSADHQPLELTAEKAHDIWGLPSAKVISKLEQGVDGVKVKEATEAPMWQKCTMCIEAKLHKFIS
jgi:hypothetical protein